MTFSGVEDQSLGVRFDWRRFYFCCCLSMSILQPHYPLCIILVDSYLFFVVKSLSETSPLCKSSIKDDPQIMCLCFGGITSIIL